MWCMTARSGVGISHGAGMQGPPASHVARAASPVCGTGCAKWGVGHRVGSTFWLCLHGVGRGPGTWRRECGGAWLMPVCRGWCMGTEHGAGSGPGVWCMVRVECGTWLRGSGGLMAAGRGAGSSLGGGSICWLQLHGVGHKPGVWCRVCGRHGVQERVGRGELSTLPHPAPQPRAAVAAWCPTPRKPHPSAYSEPHAGATPHAVATPGAMPRVHATPLTPCTTPHGFPTPHSHSWQVLPPLWLLLVPCPVATCFPTQPHAITPVCPVTQPLGYISCHMATASRCSPCHGCSPHQAPPYDCMPHTLCMP